MKGAIKLGWWRRKKLFHPIFTPLFSLPPINIYVSIHPKPTKLFCFASGKEKEGESQLWLGLA
jgi:hypothetical protein